MNRMKFLIVIPKNMPAGRFYDFPIGMAYIAAAIKSAGHAIEYLNLNHCDEPPADLIQAKLKGGDIAAVASGGLTPYFTRVRDILAAARMAQPGIFTIAGGGMISSEPLLVTRALGADAGVTAEGEETIVDIAEAVAGNRALADIPGIIFKNNGRYESTGPRSPIENLDALPFPDYDGFGMDEYLDNQRCGDRYYLYVYDNPRYYPIIASRSCPFNCTFCYHPLGKKYRSRSLDSIFAEVDYAIKKYRVNILFFYDELFAVKKERIAEFCRRIKDYNIPWSTQFRVDCVDEESMIMLREAGMYNSGFGIESMSGTILKSMKKHITREQVETALALARKVKMGVGGNLLYGDPAETWDTAMESLEWWKQNYHHTNIYMITIVPYPGSRLYDYCIEKGYITDRLEYIESGCPSINMTDFSTDEFYRLMKTVSRAVQTHTLCGEAVRVLRECEDPVKRAPLFSIDVRCPSCGGLSEYRRYHIAGFACLAQGIAIRFYCRICHQDFWLTFPDMLRAAGDAETRGELKAMETDALRQHTDLFLYMGNEEDAARAWMRYARNKKQPWLMLAFLGRRRKFRKRRRKMEEKRIVHFDCR